MTEFDIEDYIESGILELFALDLLLDQEHFEVEKLLGEHLKLGEQLEKIYMAIDAFEVLIAANPKKALRSKVIKAMEDLAKQDKK